MRERSLQETGAAIESLQMASRILFVLHTFARGEFISLRRVYPYSYGLDLGEAAENTV